MCVLVALTVAEAMHTHSLLLHLLLFQPLQGLTQNPSTGVCLLGLTSTDDLTD